MVSTGVKVYGQENVYQNDFKLGNYFITEEKYQKLKTCTLEHGDVVITMMVQWAQQQLYQLMPNWGLWIRTFYAYKLKKRGLIVSCLLCNYVIHRMLKNK